MLRVFYYLNHRHGPLRSIDAQREQILASYLCVSQSEELLASADVFVLAFPRTSLTKVSRDRPYIIVCVSHKTFGCRVK